MKKGKENISVYIIRSTAINPDPRAMKAATWLRMSGYSVKIIGWDRECSSQKEEIVNGVEIKRLQIPSSYGMGIRNMFHLLLFNLRLFFMLLHNTPDVIHACDLDTALPAMLVKKLKRTRVVYDIYDFYSESRRVGVLAPLIRYMERWIAKKSDLVILAHEKRIEQLEPLSTDIRRKIITIYNTPDDVDVKERGNIMLPTYPFFSYVGILSRDRALPSVVQTIKRIKQAGLLLAGFGPLEKELKEKLLSDEKSVFLGRVSYEEALTIQGNSLAVIALYDPEIPNNRYAAPNKLYEAAMLGRPIITSTGTLLSDIVEQEKIGYAVPYGDIDILYKTFCEVIQNPHEVELMGIRARKLYESKFSAENMKSALRIAYGNLERNSYR